MASEQPPTSSSSVPRTGLAQFPEDRPEETQQNMPAPHRQSPGDAEGGPSSSSNPPRAASPQERHIGVEGDAIMPQGVATTSTSLGLGAGRPLPPPPRRSPSPALNAGAEHEGVAQGPTAGRPTDVDRDRDTRREEVRERDARDPFASHEASFGDPIHAPDSAQATPTHRQTQSNGPGPESSALQAGPPTESSEHHNYRHRLINIAGDLLEETLVQPDDLEGEASGSAPRRRHGSPGEEDEGLGARLVHLAADFAGHNVHRIRLPQVLTPLLGSGGTHGSPNPDNGRGEYFGHSHGSNSRRRDQSQPTSPILRTPGDTGTVRTPRVAVGTPGVRSTQVDPSAARNAELPPLPSQQQQQQQQLYESPTHTNVRDSASTDPIGPLVTPDNHRILVAEPPASLNRRRTVTEDNMNRDTKLGRNLSLHLPSMPPRATTWDPNNGNNYGDQGNGNASHGHAHTPVAGLSRQRTLDTRRSAGAPSIIDTVPVQVELLDEKFVPGTVNARIHATIEEARAQRDRYAVKAKWTGWALNIAIGLQVLLGSLTTGLSAVAVNGRSAAVSTTILGALATLVASYLARARGSNEPELSITRVKDLEQFIREVENFRMDHGYEMGDKYNAQLDGYRSRFEQLLGNANGERKLSNVISGPHSFVNHGTGP